MQRREPSRNRIGEPSFGRRVPKIDFQAIQQDLLLLRSLETPQNEKVVSFESHKVRVNHSNFTSSKTARS